MNNYEPLLRTLEKNNKSMRTLSAAIGFAPNSLGAIVSAKGNLSSESLNKICRELNCLPQDVLEIVPDDAVIIHKRTCCQAKRIREGIVTVNWYKLETFINESGYTNKSLSRELGKNENYIALKKQKKHNSIEFIKLVADFLKADYKEYII